MHKMTYQYGTNLKKDFKQQLANFQEYIENNLGVFEKKIFRYSPQVSGSINSQSYIFEVQIFEYNVGGKPVRYLEYILDLNGEYFEITIN